MDRLPSTVSAPLPKRIARLRELAFVLWLAWNPARDVFRRLDYGLWRQSAHNPVMMLNRVTPDVLKRAAADPGFLAAYDAALAALDAARAPASSGRSWWHNHSGADPQQIVDRKSTRLNSSHLGISYAVFCLKKKKK